MKQPLLAVAGAVGVAALFIMAMGIITATVEAHPPAACPKPVPLPCTPTDVALGHAWRVELRRADGIEGQVRVVANDIFAAASEGARLSGAEVISAGEVSQELNRVEWWE